MSTVEDLKSFAGKACIDIYNDFDETEVRYCTLSIRKAWEIGRDLAQNETKPSQIKNKEVKK